MLLIQVVLLGVRAQAILSDRLRDEDPEPFGQLCVHKTKRSVMAVYAAAYYLHTWAGPKGNNDKIGR